MIARGALGDPLIFKRIRAFLENKEEIENDFNEKIKVFFEYVELCKRYNNYDFAKIRRICLYFINGFRDARNLRDNLSKCKDLDEIKKLLDY